MYAAGVQRQAPYPIPVRSQGWSRRRRRRLRLVAAQAGDESIRRQPRLPFE